jgi:hypothetical protein
MPLHHSGRTAGLLTIALLTFASVTMPARAQEPKHYRFAYDQPKPTGYGIVGDVFADKLKELSKGTMRQATDLLPRLAPLACSASPDAKAAVLLDGLQYNV